MLCVCCVCHSYAAATSPEPADREVDPAWASGGSDGEGDRTWGTTGGVNTASRPSRFKASVLLSPTGEPVGVDRGVEARGPGGVGGAAGPGQRRAGRQGKPARRRSKDPVRELLGMPPGGLGLAPGL